MLQIVHVRSESEATEVRVLVQEFLGWLNARYPGMVEALADYFRVQDLDGQMRELLTRFAPPKAECLLARLDGVAAGIVMTKPHSEGVCEMNRMFVRDTTRGHGVGRALVAEILSTAKALGYRRMTLAAGPQHTEAIALYRSFGFIEDRRLPDTGAGDFEVRMIRDL